ncbi:TerY-C metal binding domain-containing protein [Schlesneria paludicola]|uniref:TerY-C metal binding domain-containing protein n=1 Tax=Schlesneria paludicola TaxID=360056 RepID=UPI00029A26B6
MKDTDLRRRCETRLNVFILLGRCQKTDRCFGVRFEEGASDEWIADWAFALTEGVAGRERYGQKNVNGNFSFSLEYPGCPHCENMGTFACSCGKVSCLDARQQNVRCPWCRSKGTVDPESTVNQLGVGTDV